MFRDIRDERWYQSKLKNRRIDKQELWLIYE